MRVIVNRYWLSSVSSIGLRLVSACVPCAVNQQTVNVKPVTNAVITPTAKSVSHEREYEPLLSSVAPTGRVSMDNPDDWHICKSCGDAYERWQGPSAWNACRCKPCHDKRSRHRIVRRDGRKQTDPKANCRLCDKEFVKPTTKTGSRIYCTSCSDIDPQERLSMVRSKRQGIKIPLRRFRKKKQVDNREYVNVHSLMHEPIEKVIRKIADRRVVFTS